VTAPPASGSAAVTSTPVALTSAKAADTSAATRSDSVAPDDANEFVQRASALAEAGKTDAAVAELRRGIAKDPLDLDTWYGLAQLYHDLGKDKQALDTYSHALDVIQHAPELRLLYAELLIANRRSADAVKVLQKGIELDPDASADMKAMLGQAALGILDDSTNAAAVAAGKAPAPPTVVAKASARSAKSMASHGKKKKLCKRFCPGSFQDVAKPK
jgi:predicted Zn-dependent protease